jgi:hypothetical protein
VNRLLRGAAAGAAAGIAWKAVEPLLEREFGSPYSDAGIAVGFVSQGRWRLPLEFATQAAGGAAFGTAFARLGGRGLGRGVAAALAENAALWPAVAVIQRFHPDVRSGRWPKPFSDPRSIQVSFAGHAIFGMILGALLDPPRIRGRQ